MEKILSQLEIYGRTEASKTKKYILYYPIVIRGFYNLWQNR
ncbi:MAG: hypothetical protein APG11_01343 [Candidatus Methanofastidiosum methylothiophilum]|uniref:Uncharacterized protein n=1 Tax=Candidatus Methanofastidiosum methylothiophilum TaxID=1705564 RepID=A0A150IQD1_9EURY|nr:MAG: hypothetical protein APG10_00824 [Candidatus Methanofastidiosum methylthiophilus]KYC47187.1 MAG: hypothetical protein APG11_01343 [Candidatus Methanofastidiosum methylthiophilus]